MARHMKYRVFSGFLGAGKTMAIASFAACYLGEARAGASGDAAPSARAPAQAGGPARPGGSRLVIIENEIGETSYDDALLGSEGYAVRGMVAGCICCSLAGELAAAARGILADLAPECLVIEPTGIASPGKVLEALEGVVAPGDDVKVISVLDATRYDAILERVPKLLEDQMRSADLMLLNKTDAVAPEKAREILDGIGAAGCRADVRSVSLAEGADASVWEGLL
jgi:G3E family GTPase